MVAKMKIELPDDRPQLVVEMADGAEALLSPLGPEDRGLLEEGLEELSALSRYTRFGQGRGHLSGAELDYLSNVDQQTHVAWGVAVDGEGAGVGRYIRMDELGCAEIAVTVLDRFQNRGLGTILFKCLVAVARADGISEFCFEVMPTNLPANRMIRGIEVRLDESGTSLLGRLSLDDVPVDPHEEAFVEVMRRARAQRG